MIRHMRLDLVCLRGPGQLSTHNSCGRRAGTSTHRWVLHRGPAPCVPLLRRSGTESCLKKRSPSGPLAVGQGIAFSVRTAEIQSEAGKPHFFSSLGGKPRANGRVPANLHAPPENWGSVLIFKISLLVLISEPRVPLIELPDDSFLAFLHF